ncbi:MAG: energy transducer TonB [Pyrinomonadaceae bacterium]
MFNNLVESDAHKEDHRRKAAFFIYTLIGYAVLMLAAGVASVYAYDAHLENQNLEFLVLIAPSMEEPQPIRRNEPPKANNGGGERSDVSVRQVLIARISESTTTPDKVSAVAPAVREMPPGPVYIGDGDRDANPLGNSNGPLTPGYNVSGDKGNGNVVKIDDHEKPPPLKVEPQPQPKKQVLNKGFLISSQAISLPKPPYPRLAREAGVSGTVTVQILLDETGKVISARAVSGNPLLQAEAVKAAYRARFSPTVLSGQPVKVSGIISYNFTPQ